MTKKAITINTDTNYGARKIETIGIGEAEFDKETNNFWINTPFQNSKGEDDYMTISFDVTELLKVIGECIKEPCEF